MKAKIWPNTISNTAGVYDIPQGLKEDKSQLILQERFLSPAVQQKLPIFSSSFFQLNKTGKLLNELDKET